MSVIRRYTGTEWELIGGYTAGLLVKNIPIGSWDVSIQQSISIPHILDFTTIRSIEVMLVSDIGEVHSFNSNSGYFVETNTFKYDSTNITLRIGSGNNFFQSDFNNTGINRGWITIWYTS